jgi:antitoxin component of MazEF toxin-antitoxin module
MKFERTLNRLGSSSLSLTIPQDLVKFMELNEDSVIILDECNGIVTISKKE